MKLKIPYFVQERNVTCGLAALRMVLAYYGDEAIEKELVKQIKLHSFGTFSTDLGSIVLKRGYKVKCYTFHLGLLAPLNLTYGTKIDKKILKKIKVAPRDEMVFESLNNYLEQGGELIWDTPQIEQLESFITKNVPCIISVNTAALRRFWKTWDNGHIMVVNGFNNKEIEVLDPDPEDVGQNYKIKKGVLLPAWSINAVRSSNYLLVVDKLELLYGYHHQENRGV